MTLQEAINVFKKKYPKRKVVGYWEKPNGYVFNTRSVFGDMFVEPGQYLVTDDGEVYGTNPLTSNLDPGKMKNI